MSSGIVLKVSAITVGIKRYKSIFKKKKKKHWKVNSSSENKHIFLNSAKSFVNNCPHFQAILYTTNFNKVIIIKIFELNC